MKQETIPQFSCGLPQLDAAYALLREFVTARQDYERIVDWLGRCIDEIQPTHWTTRIENAINDQPQLERLRIEWDERAITVMYVSLVEQATGNHLTELRSKLFNTLEQLIADHDTHPNGPDADEKPLFQAAIVIIDRELQPTRGRQRHDYSSGGFLECAQKAMRSALKVLIEQLQQTRPRYYYTIALVTAGHKILPHLAHSVDLRSLGDVELNDKEGRYPKSARLAELFASYQKAFRELRNTIEEFRDQDNGSVNEMQHAARLVNLLHGETCGRLDQAQVDAQNNRRIRYETSRRRVHSLLRYIERLRFDVSEALWYAVEELKATNAHTDTPRRAIDQSVIDLEMRVINNLLAADLVLRSHGHKVEEYKRSLTDISSSAGTRAMDAAFDSIAKRFRPSIQRKAEEAAGQKS